MIHLQEGFAVEIEKLKAAYVGIEDAGPGVFLEFASEEARLSALADGPLVHIVHELVNEGNGDLFDLGFGVGDFAH
jgi:hypothetical protein